LCCGGRKCFQRWRERDQRDVTVFIFFPIYLLFFGSLLFCPSFLWLYVFFCFVLAAAVLVVAHGAGGGGKLGRAEGGRWSLFLCMFLDLCFCSLSCSFSFSLFCFGFSSVAAGGSRCWRCCWWRRNCCCGNEADKRCLLQFVFFFPVQRCKPLLLYDFCIFLPPTSLFLLLFFNDDGAVGGDWEGRWQLVVALVVVARDHGGERNRERSSCWEPGKKMIFFLTLDPLLPSVLPCFSFFFPFVSTVLVPFSSTLSLSKKSSCLSHSAPPILFFSPLILLCFFPLFGQYL